MLDRIVSSVTALSGRNLVALHGLILLCQKSPSTAVYISLQSEIQRQNLEPTNNCLHNHISARKSLILKPEACPCQEGNLKSVSNLYILQTTKQYVELFSIKYQLVFRLKMLDYIQIKEHKYRHEFDHILSSCNHSRVETATNSKPCMNLFQPLQRRLSPK